MTDTDLQAHGVCIDYGAVPVVAGLDLSIPRGRFTVLIGPNGSGKSTILRGLAGLLPLSAGRVTLDGTPITRLPSKAVARRIAFLAQSATAPEGMTVTDLVRQGRYPHRGLFGAWTAADSEAVAQALALTSVADLADRRLDSLSGGQRQRAWIAMALAQQGDILLLDEPTTWLDLAHQIELLDLVRALIRSRGATVVAVLHDLNQAARYADHLVLLRDGQVQSAGAPADVLTSDTVQDVFGVAVRVMPDPETGLPMCVPRASAR
ncbi:MAG: ABC transporter ATP-binding protein [Paracoccus sp. (in: a-proteobacteria)]|uniref:ABC transporter ATP-binding protein n=1 Tax=Paracoccus sp. TaxID=267 RepID=UPI0026DFF759|nr:ABC transporter ATP-binding protein [Paracoccus sp. (in: a-proteobacteria)]MDO5611872.1 ABC transporter ATP-binding protein [Paracoccus sp. (in: a-proteobacteria)]